MESRESFLIKSISYNVIMQIFFRVLSFFLNALLLRYVSTDLIGVCNFRLALLYTTVMFLSREPFRRALPSLQNAQSDWPKFVNTIWLVVPNGIAHSLAFGFVWYKLIEQPNETTVSNYSYSILVCCLAFVIELCGEAANLISQTYLLAKQKAVIEANSLLLFHLTFVSLSIFVPDLGALSYALARLAYSIVFVVLNFGFLLRNNCLLNSKKLSIVDIVPHKSMIEFDSNYLKLIRAYYVQSFYKQILTEGERYLITAFSLLSFSQSGIYEIINNLGSLIARFVFLPIEDASYIYFTNSLERGIVYKQHQNKQTSTQITPKETFENLMKIVSLIGTVVFVFGQSYSQLLLQLYGGDKLGKNDICVNMLRLHCVYVLLLAVNGVTESFYNATMSNVQIEKHNYRLILFSGIFLALATVLAKLFGIFGFLLANCFNMSIRIYYSSLHIKSIFSGYLYQNETFQTDKTEYNMNKTFIPEKSVCLVIIISLVFTKLSEYTFASFVHFFIGSAFFFITLFIIYKEESTIKHFILKFIKNNKHKN